MTNKSQMNVKYMVVESPNVEDLEKGVNNLVSKGFKPIGGVSVTSIGTEKLYSQAVCLTKDLR